MADKKNIVIKVKYPATGKSEAISAKTITVWNVKRIMLAVFALIMTLILLLYFFAGEDTPQEDLRNPKSAMLSEKSVEPEAAVNAIGSLEPQVEGADNKIGDITQPLPTKPEVVARVDNTLVKPKAISNRTTPANSGADKRIVSKQSLTANKAVPSKRNKSVSRAMLAQGLNGKEPRRAMAGTISVSKAKPVAVYYFTELKGMRGKKVYHEWLQNGKSVARYELPVAADRWRTYSHRLLAGKAEGRWLVRLTDENGKVLNEQNFTAK